MSVVVAGLTILTAPPVIAQLADTVGVPGPVAVVDGSVVNWPGSRSFPVDSARAFAHAALDHLRGQGFAYAHVDSTVRNRVYVTRGPVVRIGSIRVRGSAVLSEDEVLRLMNTGQGDPFTRAALERDIRFVLDLMSRRGWPLAQARVSDVDVTPGKVDEVNVTIDVDDGTAVVLDGLLLLGASRTRPSYVMRIARLRRGRSLAGFDPDETRRLLESTKHFTEVGDPRLEVDDAGRVTLIIPIREAPPGSFDLVLGVIPSTGGGGGGIVGNGHLQLRNLFGGGRLFGLKLNRLPGRVSSFDALVADPNVAGLPIGLEIAFHGIQRDSTYDQQQYRFGVSYELVRGLRAVASATRETTKPGQAGLAIRSGAQRIARSTASFFGVGVRYESVDWIVNPRSGIIAESMFERGNRNVTTRRVVGTDTTTIRSSIAQERLLLAARYFVPTFHRQLIVAGVDARILLSNEYDESDLIRLGGANSLRGYNEEQFLGRVAGRFISEYRYQIDRYAFAYLFADFGLLEVPRLEGRSGRREFLPGFGLGMQFRTEVGLINVSYAFNDADGLADGRIHVGLSFTL